MSTDYTVFEDKKRKTQLVLTESSSRFSLDAYVHDGTPNEYRVAEVNLAHYLEPSQVAELALKLLQPCFWNVRDPEKFKEDFKRKLDELIY